MWLKSTAAVRYLFILASFLVIAAMQMPAVRAATFSYSGPINTSPTFNPTRPLGATNSCADPFAGLSAQDPGYNAFGFNVSVAGTYSILMNTNSFTWTTPANDGMIFLYSPTFDPNNPNTNLIAKGDGATGCPTIAGFPGAVGSCCAQCGFITCQPLSVGVRYILVTTSNQLGGPGTFTNVIDGPGVVQNPTAANGTLIGRVLDSDGNPIEGAVTRLSGAQNRKTITDANGNYRFEEVETNGFYTLAPSRVNFTFDPPERGFSFIGVNADAAFTGLPNGGALNPLDTPEYFVRQHYLDFLGREPDEAGFNFWSDQILGCAGDYACGERRRINVSAAYFKSIEFQNTGGFVDSLYRASYGRAPLYNEFMPDISIVAHNVVVGRINWEQNLVANKQAFLDAWVERAAFSATFDLMTDSHYVDTLIANTRTGFSSSERDAWVTGLSLGSLSRADVLRQIAEDQRFVSAKFNEAFVMMEYFGYLRRDPDPNGFQFWLNKLNEFDGNFERAEMVEAFITSGEYRSRFAR